MASQFVKLVLCRHFPQRPRPVELGFESVYRGDPNPILTFAHALHRATRTLPFCSNHTGYVHMHMCRLFWFGTEGGEPVAEVGVSQLLFEREQWAKYRALERILGHPDGAVLYAKSEGIGMGELAARMCMRGSDLVKG